LPTSEGTMLTFRAGACTLWSNLLTVVAGAMAPFGGSDVRKALDVARVSLIADGIVLLNMPMRILFWATSGLMQYDVCLSGGCLRCQAVLSLLT
jgi:hypothetical protein